MIRRISHIAISVLLVLTTTGVTLSRHYCNSQLVSSSVFGKAHNCCGSHCKSCHDEVSAFRVSDNFVSSTLKISQPHQFSLDWLILTNIHLSTLASENNLHTTQFQFSSSPPIADNPPALLQVFRC